MRCSPKSGIYHQRILGQMLIEQGLQVIKESKKGFIMLNENTLLIGQVLQIRDNILAKRHAIPGSMQKEWSRLVDRTAAFDIKRAFTTARKGTSFTKPSLFNGSAGDLANLVKALSAFNQKIGR